MQDVSNNLLALPQPVVNGLLVRRLVRAWLLSVACLLLGTLLALVVGRAHYARGLLVLALGLVGWLHAVELMLVQALAPTQPGQPPSLAARWLPGWYCGFFLTQGLGLVAVYLVWTAGHPG